MKICILLICELIVHKYFQVFKLSVHSYTLKIDFVLHPLVGFCICLEICNLSFPVTFTLKLVLTCTENSLKFL
jgi:hypothetical protein